MGGRSGSPKGAPGNTGAQKAATGTIGGGLGSIDALSAIKEPARRQAPGSQSGMGQQLSSQGASSTGGGAGGSWQGIAAVSWLVGAAPWSWAAMGANGVITSETASIRRHRIIGA